MCASWLLSTAVSGDHSYFQKQQGQAFQAMVKSLLTGTVTTTRPACPPLTSVTSKGFQPSLDNSSLDASKRRGPAGNRTPGTPSQNKKKKKIKKRQ